VGYAFLRFSWTWNLFNSEEGGKMNRYSYQSSRFLGETPSATQQAVGLSLGTLFFAGLAGLAVWNLLKK